MKYLLLIFFTTSINLFSQNAIFSEVKLTQDSDTSFWFKREIDITKRINHSEPNSKNDYFKISNLDYNLEISNNIGKITLIVYEYFEGFRTPEIYSKSFQLNSSQTEKILNLKDSLTISKIPSDTYIEKWTQGVDGIIYILEEKKGNSYSFKKYWTQSAQKRFEESISLNYFFNEVEKIIDYHLLKNQFEKAIPFYGYSYRGSMVIINKISRDKKYRKYKRIKKKQLKKVNISDYIDF